ncbi:MAG: glycosyltransferase family 1 protein, partial [Pedobacter sp.]
MIKNLAILISHPIQYYSPVFKQLASNPLVNLKVFYSLGKEVLHDKGFGKKIEWDIPLLDGYPYEFLENTAKDKGTHHFNGIINSDIISRIDSHQPDVILIYGWAYRSHLKALR